jgi:hypothetical protein
MAPNVSDTTKDDKAVGFSLLANSEEKLFGMVGPVTFRNGYDVFPDRPFSKIPAVRRWQNPAGSRAVANWARHFPNHNVAVLGGRCVGFDIDIEDPVEAARLKGTIFEIFGGDPPIRHRGNTRCLLLYQAWDGAETAHYNGFDIIGAKSQFVAYGMHPSGMAYRWVGHGPYDTRLLDLPVATSEGLAALNEHLYKFYGPRRTKTSVVRQTVFGWSSTSNPTDSVHRLRSELIKDGREAELTRCVFHVWAAGEDETLKIAELAFKLFESRVDLTRGKRSGPEPWCLADAFDKALYLLNSKKPRPKPGHLAGALNNASQRPIDVHPFNRAVSEICSLDGLSRSADRISRVMASLAEESGKSFATAPTLAAWLNLNEDTVTHQRSRLVKYGLWSREYDETKVGALATFRPQIDFALQRAREVVEEATRMSSGGLIEEEKSQSLEEQLKLNRTIGFESLAGWSGELA